MRLFGEKKVEIQKLHNKIKESPYWLNFDKDYLPELRKDYHNLTLLVGDLSVIIGHSVNKELIFDDRYTPLLTWMTHDVNSFCQRLHMYEPSDKRFTNKIVYLQQYLMGVHQMLDEVDEPRIIGTEPDGWPYKLKTVRVEDPAVNPKMWYDGGWCRICEIPKKYKADVIKFYEDYLEITRHKDTVQKIIDEIKSDTNFYYRFV